MMKLQLRIIRSLLPLSLPFMFSARALPSSSSSLLPSWRSESRMVFSADALFHDSGPELSTESDLGRKLLSKATPITEMDSHFIGSSSSGAGVHDEEGYVTTSTHPRFLGDNNNEIDYTWISGYALKFQGCHHVQQWNENADENEDVRIATKRLARFRLCPTNMCSANKAAGCHGGYGDYIVDLNEFVNAFVETRRQRDEYECDTYMLYKCDCENDDGKGDDFDEESCKYNCFQDAGMEEQCVENMNGNDNAEELQPEDYLECNQYNPPNNRRRNRRWLGEEVEYFVGPYCAEQGGAVFLGLFTDDSCTEFADDYGGRDVYFDFAGTQLPYGEESLVGPECLSCLELDANAENKNNGKQTNENCEQIYDLAGKCEENLPEGMKEENYNACKYIEGIKIVRQDGIIETTSHRANPVMTATIVISAMAFVALSFYVWYLRMRLAKRKRFFGV